MALNMVKLSKMDIAEMRGHVEPPEIIKDMVDILLVTLCKVTNTKMLVWRAGKTVLNDPALLRKLLNFDSKTLNGAQKVLVAKALLKHERENVACVSVGACAIYDWATDVLLGDSYPASLHDI